MDLQAATTEKRPLCVGVLAHVDAGKTTLSEALLFTSGARRQLGRVDHGDTCLDTHALERERGITIFSKQALFSTEHLDITLIDTPGHVDFSPEAERVMPVLDCAVLVISGTDGVQAHTLTLWRLMESYRVPVFLFINKMDLPGADRAALLKALRTQLSPSCIDFGDAADAVQEQCALCDEALLETYLQTGSVTPGNLQALVENRKIFPCCFGSALKMEGIAAFLQTLDTCAPRPVSKEAFGARVYKISRDPQGNRLTWLKLTGGSLRVRGPISYVNQKGAVIEEKAVQLRRYSGEKFTAVDALLPGQTAAVTGLTETFAGMGLGTEPSAAPPVLQPVMTYRITLAPGKDPMAVLPKLRQLEEEEPLLHILWESGQIHVQIMGKVQLDVLRALVKERFDLAIQLSDQRIFYKETIQTAAEGIGHFEPLRHYAEVHLLLEPLPRGSGLEFATDCPTDVLEESWQNLILTHMTEKVHRGVLTGSPVTDLRMTLLIGKAHLKHTEGGDMRQATYRAIRQGLMQAKSLLLEPWYQFILTLPTPTVGRAITDIRAMGGEFDPPENAGEVSTLRGTVPAAQLQDYAEQVAAYTQGRGQLQLSLKGYEPCHNQQEVLEQMGYDPEADTENPPGSIFCAHGAGFYVPWDKVPDCMHLTSGRKEEKPPQLITRNLSLEDKELEAIMEREFGPVKTRLYRPPENRPAEEKLTIRPPKPQYLIVDGYNIIFAWDDLACAAKEDLQAARRQLCDRLSSYAGFKKARVVVVFDGYKVKGNPGEKLQYHNIQVVFTRENETGDSYIEALAAQAGSNYNLRVATSDALVQLSSLRSGALRMSARELRFELEEAAEQMRRHFSAK